MRRFVLVVVVAAVMAGCAAEMPALPSLEWLGQFTRPAGSVYPSLQDSERFGELSGLAVDASSGQWVAVIDDREARVAWLTVEFAAGALTVTPNRLMPLRAGPGVPERVATQTDLEGIAALPDGTFLMGEEGHIANGEVRQPQILHVTREGLVTGVIEYPAAFQIHLDQTRGLRANQGFESLTRLPNGHVIAGLEQPLIEDGEPTSFDRGAPGRLVEFVPADGGWQPGRQWTYQINPTPRVDGFDAICENGGNGLVELLALTDTRLLAMERACVQNSQRNEFANATQVFAVELDGTEAQKTLVLDLAAMAPRLSQGLRHLENFEGMAFGPRTPTGGATLLIVSDDNFRKTQQTAFLLFELR